MNKIEEQFLDIKDYRIHVVQQIKKQDYPYIIFLHDALGCNETWRTFPFDVAVELPYNVLIYSRRGHGKSDSLLTVKGLDLFVNETHELATIIEKLDIKASILIGSSDGGTIALKYAAQNQVLGIVSIAGHYINEKATSQGVQKSKHEPFNTQLRQALHKYHDEKAHLLVDSWQSVWTDDQFKSWSLEDQITNIDCPTLIIQGKKDEYATDQHAKSLGEIIPHAEVHLLDNVGHFPHKENAMFTKQLIQKFISKIRL